MLKLHNRWGGNLNKTIHVSFPLSYSTRTGSQSSLRCWVLLSIYPLKICVCWLFTSSKRTKNSVIAQSIWIYFIWCSLRNWHTRNFIKGCVLLCVFQYKNSILILTCRSKLVSYYLSKCFVILEQDYQSLKNVPLRFKTAYML